MKRRTPSEATRGGFDRGSLRQRIGFVPLAFTMIELLVVISILAILIAMLLPTLKAVRTSAVRAQCLGNLRAIMLGTQLYANANNGTYPSRNALSFGYPHEMDRTGFNGPYNLNATFITPYLRDRNKIMFCPGQIDSIYPSPGNAFQTRFCSYEYHVHPNKNYWNSSAPWVDLSKRERIKGTPPFWSCFTQTKGVTTAAHGTLDSKKKPMGMNSAMSDGSARWVPWVDVEGYWTFGGEIDYWPKYRK